VPVIDKERCKTYKTLLMSHGLVPRGRRKPGPVTIARKLATLHHFVKWLVDNDHLDHDVMSGVKLPPKAVENAKTSATMN